MKRSSQIILIALLMLLVISGCGSNQVITNPILPSPTNEEIVLTNSPSPNPSLEPLASNVPSLTASPILSPEPVASVLPSPSPEPVVSNVPISSPSHEPVASVVPSPIPSPSPSPIPSPVISRLYLSGWYATYDKRGLTSFSNNLNLFNEINPVWYNLEADYSLKFMDSLSNQSRVLTQARSNRIKILPTIQNFGTKGLNPSVVSKMIRDSSLRTAHISSLVKLVLEKNYDGIEIDYEGLPAVDKNYFTLFIKELNTALKKQQRLLSVAVYAKTSNNNTWAGPGAQDWAALAPEVDTLKIMAYDYHWASFHAGPISPIDWLEVVLNYTRTVPAVKGKLIVGLPFYGLDWYGVQAREVMYADISPERKASATRNTIPHVSDYCKWFDKNIEPHYYYENTKGEKRTVYYQDRQALGERMKLISRYLDTVKGITFWHLGGEDPGSWSVIRSYK